MAEHVEKMSGPGVGQRHKTVHKCLALRLGGVPVLSWHNKIQILLLKLTFH